MHEPDPPILDMTPDGEFVVPPRAGFAFQLSGRLPWRVKLALGAAILCVGAGAIISVVVMAYVLVLIVPVLLGLVALAAITGRLQYTSGGANSVGRHRGPV